MGFFDSKSKSKSESYLEMPGWMDGLPQEIASIFGNILNRELMSPEERIAGFSPGQAKALDLMQGWGMDGGTGASILNSLIQMGQQGAGGFGGAMDLFGRAAAGGPAVNMGMDMSKVAEAASNPYMDSMISAALRDPARVLTEQALPASALAQAASGNTMSTRGAIGDAVLKRGFEDRAADISAALRGDAYRVGLGLESNRASQNAALEDSFGSRLIAAGSGMLGAGQGAASILGLANSIGLGNIGQMLQSGMMQTAYDQAIKDWNFNNYNQPFMDAMWAASVLNPMANQYGTHHQKTTATQSMSPAQFALGAASAIMGMPGTGGGGGGVGGGGVSPQPWLNTQMINDAFNNLPWPTF